MDVKIYSNNSLLVRGFSLIEMMAVIVIIGLLASVIAPRLFSHVDVAAGVKAERDIEVIKQAITLYRFHTNTLPESFQNLVSNTEMIDNWHGPYLEENSFNDPWNNQYHYQMPGENDRDFDIWSYGADGSEGGKKTNKDIVSWARK